MKRFSGFLIFSLLWAIQAKATNAPKDIYTIQIGSFTEPQAAQFQLLSEIGMVYLESIPNSHLQRVLVSKFEDKATAETYLAKVKAIGYTDAFIAKRTVDNAKMVQTIQLGSYTVGDKIDLTLAKTLGNVYAHIKGTEIRVLIGFFPDITSTKLALDKARATGFPSAFMKETDMVWLQSIGTFETDFINLGNTVAKTPDSPVIVPNITIITTTTPVDNTNKTPPVNGDPSKSKASIAGLQEALKEDRKYNGAVNGLYDDGIRNSLTTFQAEDEMYKLYETRTKEAPQVYSNRGDVNSLQGNVDLIEFNPTTAAENLQKFSHPLAKVYMAYLYFTGLVKVPNSGEQVNTLMNDAIAQAYTNFNGKARFDYQKKYNYADIQTIIQHLAYVYEVMNGGVAIPCWMVENHNYELSQAFSGLTPPNFTECEGFESIKEIRILQAMAQDMDLLSDDERTSSNKAEKQAYIALRTELYLNPKKISLPEQELYEMWHKNLLNAVERNLKSDPVRYDILTAFKVTYFMVYDKLENHYLLNEFEEQQAKALALATLYALVNYNLGDYITNDF